MVQAEQAVLFSKSRRLTTPVYFPGYSIFFSGVIADIPSNPMHSEEFFFHVVLFYGW